MTNEPATGAETPGYRLLTRRMALRLTVSGVGLSILAACAPAAPAPSPTSAPTAPPQPTAAPAPTTAPAPAATSAPTTAPAAPKPTSAPATVAKPEVGTVKATYGTTSASTTPLWLAVDKGLFQKHGLTVEPVSATSKAGATAVVAGEAQFFLGEATTTVQAIAEKAPVEIVASMQKLNIFKFIVLPEITSPEDLKGKAIAISASGDSTELSTRSALKTLNLEVGKDVTLIQTGSSEARLAALLTGKVAGTLLSEPSSTQALDKGMHLLLDLTKAPFLAGTVTVQTDFATKNPRTIEAFLMGLVDGTQFLTDPANKQASLETIAKYQKHDPTDPTVLDGYNQYSGDVLAKDPYPDPAGMDAILDGLKSLDPARFGSLTTDKVLQPSFMADLRSSGYLKSVWGDSLT